jgi:cytochrome c peroxidase
MRFVTDVIVAVAILLTTGMASADTLRESVLRKAAIKAGLVPVESLVPVFKPERAHAGRLLFESKLLSLTQEISCQNCHLDRFSSADGIPLGIGTRGVGEGIERVRHGGDTLPRNTLPLWGRGALGFDTFFWDGRIDASSGGMLSPFGTEAPSADPLVVTAHLPPVEIREMVRDNESAEALRTETISSAHTIYAEIEKRIREDQILAAVLTRTFGVAREKISFRHIADSIASFIRDRFRLQPTRFEAFVFGNDALNDREIAGGLLFYGRARCVACHNGPYFSDLSFHAVPFSQLGFGRNGFGIDYGRYNVTLDPADLYKFRTPPLHNVSQTGPYSHSGSEYDIGNAIRAHVDPLQIAAVKDMDTGQRAEFYRRLGQWAKEPIFGVELDDSDIADLTAFLETLSFPDVRSGASVAVPFQSGAGG